MTTAESVLRPATSGEEWLAIHVFYAANSNPMLTECVAPLVAGLREDGLIRRWFFIKYWQEGPHVRLRLLPATPADRPAVLARVAAALDRFLAGRPALFDVDGEAVGGFHKDMYVFEYGEEAWDRDYGEAGMPVRPNNSYVVMPYEPEYDRYGGEVGVAVAEWHFEHSSDLVLRLLASTNVHVRTVMLGLSTQLALVLGHTFRPDPGALALFLQYYCEFWKGAGGAINREAEFDRGYDEMADALRRRVVTIREALESSDGPGRGLALFASDWAEHCRELRDVVVQLTEAGKMELKPADGQGPREPMLDADVMLGILLSGYIHMTNNRLGVGVTDEAYLAHLLRRAVIDTEPVAAP